MINVINVQNCNCSKTFNKINSLLICLKTVWNDNKNINIIPDMHFIHFMHLYFNVIKKLIDSYNNNTNILWIKIEIILIFEMNKFKKWINKMIKDEDLISKIIYKNTKLLNYFLKNYEQQ